MYYTKDEEQLSMEEFFLPFGGRLRKDNRWAGLAAGACLTALNRVRANFFIVTLASAFALGAVVRMLMSPWRTLPPRLPHCGLLALFLCIFLSWIHLFVCVAFSSL